MIEKHYSKYITEHSDDISRNAMLSEPVSAAGNVLPFDAVAAMR